MSKKGKKTELAKFRSIMAKLENQIQKEKKASGKQKGGSSGNGRSSDG